MKKFKHKPTGKICIYKQGGNGFMETETGQVPLWVLQNGSDWEEVFVVPRYVKALSGFFIEKELTGKIFDTTEPFPTQYEHCKDLTWEKVLGEINKIYFQEVSAEEYYKSYPKWGVRIDKGEPAWGYDFQYGEFKRDLIQLVYPKSPSFGPDKWKVFDTELAAQDWVDSKRPYYKVVAYKERTSGNIYTKYENWWGSNSACSIRFGEDKAKENADIHSVKRLSDGEVFTVGDNITGTMSCDENKAFYGYTWIKGFEIDKDGLVMHISTGTVYDYSKRGGKRTLEGIKKYVKPLFTTEDGVEIYEGDKYVKVNNHYDYSIVTGFTAEGQHDCYKGLKFSTQEKAQEYVDLHKKKYSLEDIKKILGSRDFIGSDFLISKLKEYNG